MERMAWTDERLQGRFDSIDRRFDEIDRRFDRIETAFVELRREMRFEFGVLHTTLNRVGGGVIVGLIGVIAAVFVNGA